MAQFFERQEKPNMTRIPQIQPDAMNEAQKRFYDQTMASTGRSDGMSIQLPSTSNFQQ